MNYPKLRWMFAFLLAASLLAPAASRVTAKGIAEHVVVVVWDGMRPDFITPQYCPNLYSLATNGVFFRRNHCAYISSTEVNGAVLATGIHPGRNGIIANAEYHPEISFTGTFGTEVLDAIRRSDLITGGNYLAVSTVAEIIQKAGLPTFVCGTKAVVLLQDRGLHRVTEAARKSVTLFRGMTIPRAAYADLKKVNDDKDFPADFKQPNTVADAWTTRALVRGLWKKGVPKYSLLWLSDPDNTQHQVGPGAPTSIQSIESSDKNLGEMIDVLQEKRLDQKTDIFVVSDHGFSTIQRGPDLPDILRKAKFSAHTKLENPERGDVMVVGLGGSALFYVIEQDEPTIQRLAAFLQTSDFAGVLFSRLPIEGTFPLEAVRHGQTNHPPDLVLSLRWSANRNEHGAPGLLTTTGGDKNKGSHASLSRYDMNNTLVASGPDFKRGVVNQTPSGNIDVAPTILDILGIPPPDRLDGRVLREAYASYTGPAPEVREQRIEARRRVGFLDWSQYLNYFEVDGSVYFVEGNGEPNLP